MALSVPPARYWRPTYRGQPVARNKTDIIMALSALMPTLEEHYLSATPTGNQMLFVASYSMLLRQEGNANFTGDPTKCDIKVNLQYTHLICYLAPPLLVMLYLIPVLLL